MAEGFYLASENSELPQRMLSATESVFTIFTNRQLHYRLFDTAEEAHDWYGLKMGPTGEDIFYMGWTQEELDQLDLSEHGTDWARGHIHELVEHISKGGTLPFETKMKGGATATLISKEGHLITNHHLVSGIQQFHQLPDGKVVLEGLPVPHHSIKTSKGMDLGPIRLCYVDSSIDLAILKLEAPPEIEPIQTRKKRVQRHERIWHWGYPQLSRRPAEQRQFFGYPDAKYHLAYSVGLVLTDPQQSEWFTDADSALGYSGCPVLDDTGCLVGLFWGGGAGGGLAASLSKDQRYRYRRVVDIFDLKKQIPQFFS